VKEMIRFRFDFDVGAQSGEDVTPHQNGGHHVIGPTKDEEADKDPGRRDFDHHISFVVVMCC